MRFLQIMDGPSCVVFDQPVLGALLLSTVVRPQQTSIGLEAIAERLGVTVLGRHIVPCDAMVTGEIFLKLVPLLAERNIDTLGQARDAAQKIYCARVTFCAAPRRWWQRASNGTSSWLRAAARAPANLLGRPSPTLPRNLGRL